MILICLWPYAMRHTNNVANATPQKGKELSPLEKFLGVQITPKLRHFHAFGCPTYVLDNALQSGQGIPKWKHRSRLGVYLRPSPSHARSVALVLNLCTGHVSPQFHVKFDDFFEMVQDKPTDLDAPEPEWKYLSGFAVWKGQSKTEVKGVMDRLLDPRQGPATVIPNPSSLGAPNQPAEQQQDQMTPVISEDTMGLPEQPLPAHQPMPQLPQPQPVQPLPAAHQTRSGRVIRNTPKEVRDSLLGKSCLTRTNRRMYLQLPHNMQSKSLWKIRLHSPHLTTQTYCTGIKQ